MKASQLIGQLTALMLRHGDVEMWSGLEHEKTKYGKVLEIRRIVGQRVHGGIGMPLGRRKQAYIVAEGAADWELHQYETYP